MTWTIENYAGFRKGDEAMVKQGIGRQRVRVRIEVLDLSPWSVVKALVRHGQRVWNVPASMLERIK